MRRKINVAEVRLGMFIAELCGSWMDHPFWKSSFKLVETRDLQALQRSSVREVWIDTSRGLDVERADESEIQTEDQTVLAVEQVLRQVAEEKPPEPAVGLEDELQRARQIQARARTAVIEMFTEVRMGNALNTDQLDGLVDEINRSVSRNTAALISLVRLKDRDDYTYLHSVAVCALMLALGRQLGLSPELNQSLGMAGLLHDVGKMMIPDAVLNKPGRLTDDEFDVVRTHPERGWEVLVKSGVTDEIVLDVCRHHHERVDGMGYPARLSGDALTLFARMSSVCDVYDAITSNRCYKEGWAPAEALRKMASWQDGHFDERIFKAFVKTVGIYPVGTMVKLRSGRLAVVMGQSSGGLLLPVVKVFFSTRSNAPIPVQQIDLSTMGDAVESLEDSLKWGIDISHLTGLAPLP